MTELSEWFNRIADEAQAPDDMLAKINRLKQLVRYRARRAQDVARQRDSLLIRIAELLGISRDEFPEFFEDNDEK